jgi:hypothetical protein
MVVTDMITGDSAPVLGVNSSDSDSLCADKVNKANNAHVVGVFMEITVR